MRQLIVYFGCTSQAVNSFVTWNSSMTWAEDPDNGQQLAGIDVVDPINIEYSALIRVIASILSPIFYIAVFIFKTTTFASYVYEVLSIQKLFSDISGFF